jgi:hypothetical protein
MIVPAERNPVMFSINDASALVTALVVLTGVVMLPHDTAAADPNPDDQFVALLDQKQIPALENVPSLIATAHRICRQLDGGMPVDGVVDDMKQRAFNANSGGGPYPPDRVMRTVARFISASVEAYCPNNQAKIAAISAMANPVPGSQNPTQLGAARTRYATLAWQFPSGETGQPDPPQVPPAPPTVQIMTPPQPVVKPPSKQPPPGPQQEPAAPAPVGPPDGGGGGPDSPPAPPTPPGRVRLAP